MIGNEDNNISNDDLTLRGKKIILGEEQPSNWRQNVALGIIGSSFVGTLCLISPFVIMQLKTPLPYMSTPRKKILDGLKEISMIRQSTPFTISNSSNNNKIKMFYDLGSGDGEAVLAAASMKGWKAIGIEMNPTLYLIACIRRLFFSSSQVRRQSSFVLGNMWKHNLKNADAVMIFGVTPIIPQISKKVSTECKPGTFFLSYRFRIPTLKDNANQNEVKNGNCKIINGKECNKHENRGIDADLVYDNEEMRIYRLNGKDDYNALHSLKS